MKKLNPDQLYVEFKNGITMTEPVIGRKYTLTHSDITADLFLTIDQQFDYQKINAMRDEVLAEWKLANGCPFLYVSVYVDDAFDPAVTALRDAIFRRELPLALEAIRFGDRKFFAAHSALDCTPIWIHFRSTNPLYNKFEYWGTPGDYQ
ncbi:staygreen family protein [Jeotgalibacillus aurantiacus]|uniref:staygreen family protein n=1 Tax=Jeotgalibacillus aurantiacus TaxID=2763266 RepID=UPI001D09D9A5|nr:staygreen family protein [Jeotgalibacillus aurantiacus]